MSDQPADIAAMFEDARRPAILIREAYETHPGRARDAALVKYVCQRPKCYDRLLLIVWQSPLGILYYANDYRLPPAKNLADSVPAARARRTLDGDRHWPASAGILTDEHRGVVDSGVPLNCKHPLAMAAVSTGSLLEDAEGASPGKPRVYRVT